MTQKHLVFIINPKSGIERKKSIRRFLDQHLDLSLYTYDVQHTRHEGHGRDLAAAAAAAGAFGVVAVGGDGSVNDVVSGLLGSGVVLGIIPKGSGNGLARTLHIPLDVGGAISVLNEGHLRAIDVGFADEHLFVSNAGVAFDALIARKFRHSEQRGLAMYSWLVVRHLWAYKSWTWELAIDGHLVKEQAFMVNVANGDQFGYDFRIAPQARIDDGLLDVIVIRKFPKILGGFIAIRAMFGTLDKSAFVRSYKARTVIIRRPNLRFMQTDGDEVPCGSSVICTIQPGAQRVLAPKL